METTTLRGWANWRPKAIFWDVWATLVTAGGIETVHMVLEQLGFRVDEDPELADRFLRHCLTTNTRQKEVFLVNAANHINALVRPGHLESFEEILDREKRACAVYGDVPITLESIKRAGIPQGIISNIWPFPVGHIFDSPEDTPEDKLLPPLDLGKYFAVKILSCDVGHRKPEKEIFLAAAESLGLKPEDCLLVGDSVNNDIKGALDAGMKAALIDRHRLVSKEVLATIPEALYLDSLVKLLPALGIEPVRA